MRQFKLLSAMALVLALFLTSCSKDDDNGVVENANLSFNAVLNNLINNNASTRQAIEDIPVCSDGTPTYVEVILTGPNNVGSTAAPQRVELNPVPEDYDGDGEDEFVTAESSDLSLPPGTYELVYFVVYDAADEPIWIAPSGGDLEDYVNNPLPQTIELASGEDNYVSVDVLCFDDRMLNEFGSLYFRLEPNKAIEFCVSGTYCDESGKSYSSEYSVNVWSYDGTNKGNQLYTEASNTPGEALCLRLPDIGGTDVEDQYYFEITLNDSDTYGDVENSIIREGAITDTDVRSLFDGEEFLNAFEFYAGACGQEDSPVLFDMDPVTPPPSSDAILNPEIYGFEDGGQTLFYRNDQWSVSTDQAATGTYSMKLDVADVASAPNRMTVQGNPTDTELVVAAGTYTASVKVWIDPSSDISKFNTNFSDPFQAVNWDLTGVAKGEWVTLTQEVTLETYDNTTIGSKMLIQVASADINSASAVMYVDDIELNEEGAVAPPPTATDNIWSSEIFGFEDPENSAFFFQHPEFWSISTDFAVQGANSLKLDVAEVSSLGTSAKVQVQDSEDLSFPAGDYTISMKVYIDSATDISKFNTNFSDPFEAVVWDLTGVAKEEWVTLTQDLTLADYDHTIGSKQVIQIKKADINSSSALMYIDDLQLIER